MKKDQAKSLERRDFLTKTGFGLGAAGAAIAVMSGQVKAAEPEAPTKGSGYRETEHVKKYYELARF